MDTHLAVLCSPTDPGRCVTLSHDRAEEKKTNERIEYRSSHLGEFNLERAAPRVNIGAVHSVLGLLGRFDGVELDQRLQQRPTNHRDSTNLSVRLPDLMNYILQRTKMTVIKSGKSMVTHDVDGILRVVDGDNEHVIGPFRFES
jgi:hypothetical protein